MCLVNLVLCSCGAEGIIRLFNRSTFLYMDNVGTVVDTMKVWALALTICSIVMLAVVIGFIIRPTVYAVEDNKHGNFVVMIDTHVNTFDVAYLHL